ncbi:hypothetical protein GCM10023334_025100 [Nonomuraea thailandensis]
MDWSRQSPTFTSGRPVRSAARALEAALGIVLEQKHDRADESPGPCHQRGRERRRGADSGGLHSHGP